MRLLLLWHEKGEYNQQFYGFKAWMDPNKITIIEQANRSRYHHLIIWQDLEKRLMYLAFLVLMLIDRS